MNLLSFFQFVGVHIEDHSDGSRVMLYYFKIWLSVFLLTGHYLLLPLWRLRDSILVPWRSSQPV